jgi:hypothetical protein
MWSDPETEKTGKGPTYFVLSAAMSATKQMPTDMTGIEVKNGVWISRVKCTPSLQWEVSSCTWGGKAMGNCVATPNQNTTILDTLGLDSLAWYMTGTPRSLYDEGNYIFGLPAISTGLLYDLDNTDDHQARAPSLNDYANVYGLIAQSIAAISTSGYYGTATVPTEGQAPKPVYIVRTYILALVVIMLSSVTALSISNIIYHHLNHLPWRKSSFLTIANAVRGPWWDQAMYGSCALGTKELRRRHKGQVMFGVDPANTQHIGFGPTVQGIYRDAVYYGKKNSASAE